MKTNEIHISFKFKTFFIIKKTCLLLPVIIFVFTAGCNKEASVVNPADYYSTVATTTASGYYFPEIVDHYPKSTDVDLHVNTKFAIVFNIPVIDYDLPGAITISSSSATPITFTLSPASGATRYVTLTFSRDLEDGEIITVTPSSIINDAVNSIALTNIPSPFTFTLPATATADTVNPTYTPGSEIPLDTATGIVRDVSSIRISFSEAIDFNTVNSSTFYLHDDTNGVIIPATYNLVSATEIELVPVPLLAGTAWHTVTLTTGVEDMSGNSLGAGLTWTFQTAAFVADAVAPGITGPDIIELTTTSVLLSWSTTEPATYTINFGRSDAVGSSQTDPGPDYISSRYILVPGLTAGQRYWYDVTVTDLAGNPTTSAVSQFNLYTPEVPVALHQLVNNQGQIKAVKYIPIAGNTGISAIWQSSGSGFSHVYGQLFSSAGTELWPVPQGIFTLAATTYSNYSAVNDETNGIIAAASDGTSIYMKRIDSTATFFNWGAGSTTAAGTGLLINTGTKGKAVPVYRGVVNTIQSGQVDMGGLGLANYFFEDKDIAPLSVPIDSIGDFVNNNDILYDVSAKTGTAVVKTGGTWDHQYILGQVAPIYTAGNAYVVGDVSTLVSTTVTDHTMNVAGALSSAGTVFYTGHGYIPSAGVGDIIEIGGSYARITALSTITTPLLTSGTETARVATHLYDVNAATCSQYDVVIRTTPTTAYAIVTSAAGIPSDLTLSASLFTGGENYELHSRIRNGVATAGSGGTTLVDSTMDFTAVPVVNAAVGTGDYLFIVNSTYTAIISGPYEIQSDTATSVTCGSGVFASGDYYIIVSRSVLGSGTSDNADNIIINTGASWNPGVTANDMVVNTSVAGPPYAKVAEVSNTVLKLDTNIFSGVAGSLQNYSIYHEYCDTHIPVVTDFYEITVDPSITINNGDTVNFYNTKESPVGTQLQWTASASISLPANPFLENDVDLTGLGLVSGLNGSIVFNYTSGANAYIDTSTYAIKAYSMSLSSNIFTVDNELYRLFNFNLQNTDQSDVICTGAADSYTLNHLADSAPVGQFGSVQVGDVVYNIDDNTYAMIVSVAPNDLTLTWDCFNTGNERYIVFRRRGVFCVWESGVNIAGKVVAMETGTETTVATNLTLIANASDPYTVSDGMGNAYVIYKTSGNLITARLYNGAMTQIGAALGIDSGGGVQTIIDVRSDGSGGAVILFTRGATLRVQRIVKDNASSPTAINVSWGAAGRQVIATATYEQKFVYDRTNDAVVVVWNDASPAVAASNIWVRRIASVASPGAIQLTGLAASIQQNPSVFLEEPAGLKVLVVWDDNRFLSNGGWGIFGVKLNVNIGTNTLTKDATWNANSGGTADANGVALVYNNFNENTSYPVLFSYNNGANPLLFWVDYENSDVNGSDLVYIKPDSYMGSYLPAW